MESTEAHELNLRSVLVFLPIISVASQLVGVVVAYVIGVNIGNIEPFPFVPYISKAGDRQPNGSVFTFFIVLSCFVTGYVIWIQYRQIAAQKKCRKVNHRALCFGGVFIAGKVVLSSFQMTSSYRIHLAGAGIYFIAVTVYMILRSYMMFKISRSEISMSARCKKLNKFKAVFLTRCLCCVFMLLTLVAFAPFMLIPQLKVFNRGGENVAQGLEYFMVTLKLIFTMTLTHEFFGIVRVKSRIEFVKEGNADNIPLNRGTTTTTITITDHQLTNGVDDSHQIRMSDIVGNRVNDGIDGTISNNYKAISGTDHVQKPGYRRFYSAYM